MKSFAYCIALFLALAVATNARGQTSQPVYTLPPGQVQYKKGYPAIPPEIKAADEARRREWKRLDDDAWHRAEPDVARWAANGKPYIALALNPDDLPQAEIPAFPGAEGGGMYTVGGRGGRVFVVTSLADSGPGTFREACEAGGPRIVVFNVAGIIHLDRPIHIRAPYITIAGQTAPGDGICVAGRSTKIDTHDVVVRYMRFRRGITELADRDDALGGDAPIGNIIIDHCSCSWGLDETLSIYRQMYPTVPGDESKRLKLPVVNITIQWTIITEGLDTYHHAFGATWGGRNSLFSHNLFACNTGRNASIGMNYDFNWINNVVFNWRHRTLDGGDDLSLVNCINNYYKPGPVTNDSPVKYRVLLPQPKRTKDPKAPRSFGRYYVEGNVVDGNERVTANNWDGGVQFPGGAGNDTGDNGSVTGDQAKQLIEQVRLTQPLPMAPVTIQPAKDAYEAVLSGGGATLPRRDSVDQRAVEQTRTGKVQYDKGIITDISQVGGYPQYAGEPVKYSQNDGIPDWWKAKYHLDVNDRQLASKDAGDGYTYIEKYLDGLDPTVKVDWKDLKNDVNTLGDGAALRAEPGARSTKTPEQIEAKYEDSLNRRANDILSAIGVIDAAKAARVHDALVEHWRAVKAYHESPGAALVKVEGMKAKIPDPADPAVRAMHDKLIAALSADLMPEQVSTVKDKLTVGKLEFTYKGYEAIVPNLTDTERAKIRELLTAAREEAIDARDTDAKSAVFKKYKKQIQAYLNDNGRNWDQMYKEYAVAVKAKKAAAASQPAVEQ